MSISYAFKLLNRGRYLLFFFFVIILIILMFCLFGTFCLTALDRCLSSDDCQTGLDTTREANTKEEVTESKRVHDEMVDACY